MCPSCCVRRVISVLPPPDFTYSESAAACACLCVSTRLPYVRQAGTDDLKTLTAIYSQLGNAYFYLGEYSKAMQYHKHDLTLARWVEGCMGDLWGLSRRTASNAICPLQDVFYRKNVQINSFYFHMVLCKYLFRHASAANHAP